MGCTEQRFICYNTKKRKKQNYNLVSQNEPNNQNNMISTEINNNNILQRENNENNHNINTINNNNKNEENKIESQKKEEEDSKDSDDDNGPIPYRNIIMLRDLTPYLQTKNNPNFNFPEVKEEKYVGKGLKKMKGYISIVPMEELEKRRKAFWGTRIEGNSEVWNFLKGICELPKGDEKNIKPMLEAYEITPLEKCINVTIDKNGEVYEIPNYCINDPVEYDLPENHTKKPKNKEICFFGRKGVKQIEIKMNNDSYVEKVKEIISKEFGMEKNEVRIFFSGKELKDGNELWKYNIDNECVIIIL